MRRGFASSATTLVAVLLLVPVSLQGQTFRIGGRILAEPGVGLAGAKVSLRPLQDPFEQGLLLFEGHTAAPAVDNATSDVAGYFELSSAPSGIWSLEVEKRGFVPMVYSRFFILSDEELPAVELRVDEGLKVHIRSEDGMPVWGGALLRAGTASPEVWQAAKRGGWWPADRWALSRDGVASLPRAVGEKLRFLASGHGYLEKGLVDIQERTVSLTLSSTDLVTVKAVDSRGKPVVGALARSGRGFWPEGRTDEKGEVEITPAADGGLIVNLYSPDGRHTQRRWTPPTRPTGGALLGLQDKVEFTGQVIDAFSGRPIAGAFVWSRNELFYHVRTDDQGRYAVPDNEGSRALALRAAAIGYFPAKAHTRVGEPGRNEGPLLKLVPASGIDGRVVDEEDAAIGEVALRAVARGPLGRVWASLERLSMHEAASAGNGFFWLSVLIPGATYDLYASARGYAPAKVSIGPLEPYETVPEVKIVLLRGRTAFGSIVDSGTGEPIARAMAAAIPRPSGATDGSGELVGEHPVESSTDENGYFELVDLGRGRFELSVEAPGYAPTTVRGLRIPAGAGRTDLGTIALDPGAAIEGFVFDPQESPVEGAAVCALQKGRLAEWTGSECRSGWLSRTDIHGRFVLEDLRAGERVNVKVEAAGYVRAEVSGVQAPTEEPLRILVKPVARVAGRVLDASGNGVAQVGVSVAEQTGEHVVGQKRGFREQYSRVVETGSDGSFATDVTPGRVLLRASAAGYEPSQELVLKLSAGDAVEGIELVMKEGAVIEGFVHEPGGGVLAGSRVRMLRPAGSANPYPSDIFETTTDEEGFYRLESLPTGAVLMAAEHDRYPQTVKEAGIQPGKNRLDIELEAGWSVSGRTFDDAGEPLGGTKLRLARAGDVRSPDLETISAHDGSFRIGAVGTGAYRLVATREGYAAREAEALVNVAGSDVEGLELRLETGGVVSGRILGLDFDETAEVAVRAQREGHPERSGEVDYEGLYRVGHLAAGSWLIVARLPQMDRQAQGSVTVDGAGSETFLDLDFAEGLVLSGRVLVDGEPASGITVRVRGIDRAAGMAAVTRQSGEFSLNGLDPGTYRLEAIGFASGLFHQEVVELTTDRDLLIDLSPSRVSGRVVTATDSRGLEGAVVSLELRGDSSVFSGAMYPGTTTGADGSFVIAAVPPGSYRALAKGSGFAPGHTDLEVEPGVAVDQLEIVVETSSELTLESRFQTGGSPSRLHVAILDSAGQTVVSGSYPTSDSGRLTLDTVPKEGVRLLVSANGAASHTYALAASASRLEVVLAAAARIRLHVRSLVEDDRFATARLVGSDGAFFVAVGPGGQARESWIFANGDLSLANLPPGDWVLQVTAPNGRSWSERVVTTPGKTSDVELE